jgi:hypothetical protein
MRRSHVAYLGRGQEATVHRCESCGATEQGPPRERAAGGATSTPAAGRGGGSARRRQRPLPDGGSPDNPVIDGETARLLRERFGAE